MKIVTETNTNTILLSRVTEKHFVTGMMNGNPALAVFRGTEQGWHFIAFRNGNKLGYGLSYSHGLDSYNSFALLLDTFKNNNLQAFVTYQEALKWILDNS